MHLLLLPFLLLLACSAPRRDRPQPSDASGLDAFAPASDGGYDASPSDGGSRVDGGLDRACEIEEICGNGLDDDCDGSVDDGCGCVPGESAACFRGAPSTRARGLCADGTMLCEGFEFGSWSGCEGDVLASEETCDVGGLDEDCDGVPNDGCECADGEPDLPCGSDEGECAAGVQRCAAGSWTDCEGAIGPGAETCDGLDEDCDGRIDETLTRACGIDTGACRMGTASCRAGRWGACAGEAAPEIETCDGIDEDCDGTTDERVTRPCGSDVGRCVAGTETCEAGVFSACDGEVGPVAETCNAQDDDCDGTTDEALVRACGTDVGECTSGTETCRAGTFGACTGSIAPRIESCDGSRDEDCDGATDEGCMCTTGATRPCGTDVGRCVAGSQRCDATGMWGACTGGIVPRTETCDGTDDDCDGATDEGCDCITGRTRVCGTDIGECATGTETCSAAGRWGPCTGAVGPAAELCNMRDDDCDRAIDEDDVCPRVPPLAMCPGARTVVAGTAVTLAGMGSDPDGGAVTYAWTVVSRPAGSAATPMPPTAASTSFTPDADGDYTLRLCVTDDEGATSCCTTSITATPRCTPPSAPAITSCGSSWDRRPIVEFPALPAGVVYELFADGVATPYATVTAAGQNYFRPALPLGPGGPPPGRRTDITARACRTSDRACCATSAAISVSMIESCITPVSPTASNLVFSEYVVDGDGACPGMSCEAGEAIEITNLSNCPVALAGSHFSYCNGTCSAAAYRWMDFGADDVIPPRGVYVAIRERALSMCAYPFFGPDDPGLFGLRVSRLTMMGPNLASGWFNNGGGPMSQLRIAGGAWVDPTTGTTLELVAPYLTTAASGGSIAFDAIDACGEVSAVSTPTEALGENQLGRLWHPCDAVVAPNPPACR
jgi:hypothetical protein